LFIFLSSRRLPINPRYGKLLNTAKKTGIELFKYTILLVAVLSERTPFVPKRGNKVEDSDSEDDEYQNDESKKKNQRSKKSDSTDLSVDKFSDAIARMRATGAYFYSKKTLLAQHKASTSEVNLKLSEFCTSHFLHRDTLDRILDLQRQLQSLCVSIFNIPELGCSDDEPLQPPSLAEETALRQILL